MLVAILFRLSENSFLMDEISEKIFNEELNKVFLVKIQIREDHTWLSTTWRYTVWSEEIQNTHYSSHSVSLNLKDDSCWKPIKGQIKLNVREYLWVVNWRWWIVFTKIATQEVAKNLKNWERCYREGKYWKNFEDWKNFPCRMIRNPVQWVCWARSSTKITRTMSKHWRFEISSTILTYEQLWRTYVPHQALVTSSSRKPSREVEMPQSSRENMSILGNVFDRQHAQRDPEELHNDSRNLATSLAILRKEGIGNSGSEEPWQSIPLSFSPVRARREEV